MFKQIIVRKEFARKDQYNYVVICNNCKTAFKIRGSLIVRGKGCFCSTKCAGEARKGIRISRATEIKKGQRLSKNTEFKEGNKSWSTGIKLYHLRGKNAVHWKGGKTTSLGYSLVHTSTENKTHYSREHRLIVEKELNRKLLTTEVVHHINCKKYDNRIENLYLFRSQSEHMTYHLLIKNNKIKEITESNIRKNR
jgi:hypothetical protein